MATSSAFTLVASHSSHQHRHHEFKGREINDLQKWRRGWDSNPRYGSPYARFRGEYFQPLSHLSAVVAGLIVAERCVVRQSRGGPFANALRRANLSLQNDHGRRAIAKTPKSAC